ncbi:hypothetical protein GQ53DRAFT_449224 [Thozetella sp. PMI_491]|nr:hypothetical protein GQ53DRAFT_449224 [Thozetella sp. PMI_491]
MLLSCLPNLTVLVLELNAPRRTIPIAALRAAGVSNLSLQTLDTCGSDSDLRHRLGGIFEMSLDSIRTLNLAFCSGHDIRGLISPLPKLRNICITNGEEISGSDIESLLSCCEDLNSFTYEAASSSDYISPPEIIEHLGRHKEALRILYLDLVHVRIVEGSFHLEPIPSLHNFSSLQDLFLNTLFIFNSPSETLEDDNSLVQLLPRSIVKLRLASNVNTAVPLRLTKALLRLAETVLQGQFPSLKMIGCDIGEQLHDYAVAERFSSVGVNFGYGTWPFSEMRPRDKIIELDT